jgi:acyl-CoA synthetase (AMP-forming)/AMP-acid ligase II
MDRETPTSATDFNIASYLPRMARERPFGLAIVYPEGRDASGKRHYSHYTFRQLDDDSNTIAAGLEAYGLKRGMRTVLMVKPSREFFALTFAIFKLGAVPVLVDPGIGVKNLGACLGRAEPEAFIGIPAAHAARVVLGWARPTLRHFITVGRRVAWGGTTLAAVRTLGAQHPDWQMAATGEEEVAAILFTSGSTGPPKGAIYRHGNFHAQVETIRAMYDIQPGEIDLPTFPLFALFDPALGMTAVIPDMDATRPAAVDPALIWEAIEDFGCTSMFGSPALLNTISRWGEKNGRTLPSIQRVLTAGAPAPEAMLRRMAALLPPEARIHPPYGATESLPVATCDHVELLEQCWPKTREGAGVCVGRPVANADVRILRITDDPMPEWSDDLLAEPGEIGEISVAGPMVTTGYLNDAENTAKAKIQMPDGSIRHRMGDLGRWDEEGRIWFCGRKSHRVPLADTTLFTVPIEQVMQTHPALFRCALVGARAGGEVVPVLCYEREPDATIDRAALEQELAALAAEREGTARIRTFLPHPGFPVDIRHNAKIGREKLAVWATEELTKRLR